MSLEEAIRTIEIAIAEVEWEYPMKYADAFDEALTALREKAEEGKLTAEGGKPLTLKELWDAERDAVWVTEMKDGEETPVGYMLVSAVLPTFGAFLLLPPDGIVQVYHAATYGDTWRAYRCKPKEPAK